MNVYNTLKSILILPRYIEHVVQTHSTFTDVGPIKFAVNCHLDSRTVILEGMTVESGLKRLYCLRLCAIISGEGRGSTQLGLNHHATKRFNKHRGCQESLEGTQILATFKTGDRRFINDIRTYKELLWVALAAKHEPDMGHTTGHFDDHMTSLAIVDASKEADRIHLRCER